jgi:hypothetical protein
MWEDALLSQKTDQNLTGGASEDAPPKSQTPWEQVCKVSHLVNAMVAQTNLLRECIQAHVPSIYGQENFSLESAVTKNHAEMITSKG